jgi:phenylpropionate dioxygenase-like ring-hydroxylating dioxygenase large terminal subunit
MFAELTQQLLSHLQQEKAIPSKSKNFIVESDIYVNPTRFQLEMAKLKDRHLGPLEELRTNPRYILNEEARPRFFLNSCPHRGARIIDGVCSYHGWIFDKEGKLVKSTGPSCPYPERSLRLREIPAINVGGMILEGALSPYTQEVIGLTGHARYLEKSVHTVKCNWKLLAESLLETYHFPFAHRPYLSGFENAFYSLGFTEGQDARIAVPLSSFEDSADMNIMYHLFPYLFVLLMSSGLVWFHIAPVSVRESRLERYLYSYGQSEERAQASLALLDKILDQDFAILEGQQENAMTSQRYHFTGYEKLIQHFHRNIAIMLE